MENMKQIKIGILLFVVLWVVVGLFYPLLVTALANFIFPWQAKGSLISDSNEKIIGSTLIGQHFSDPKYFWSRPSATAEFPYNPLASGGSNLGPTNDELKNQFLQRKKALNISGINDSIPLDLLTASASGLDPHISIEGAILQVPRISKARGMDERIIQELIFLNKEGTIYSLFGAQRVNVLQLNIALDKLEAKTNGK